MVSRDGFKCMGRKGLKVTKLTFLLRNQCASSFGNSAQVHIINITKFRNVAKNTPVFLCDYSNFIQNYFLNAGL